jgi:hypothetical protein
MQLRRGLQSQSHHCIKLSCVENRSPPHYKNSLIDIQADLIISFKCSLKLTVMVFPSFTQSAVSHWRCALIGVNKQTSEFVNCPQS